ncbi:prolyl oligopeptidase family serine peptidase [Vibrio sinaloensis]|uniref:prolyl oligopeptidase family serine peptidase n=1 Tax=Photobacterium sp. (strain ATCC 43367) TaxID=379097 RepID=UPI0035EB55A3
MKLLNVVLLSISSIVVSANCEELSGDSTQSYEWLRDDSRTRSQVIQYLEQQNLESQQALLALQPLADKLLQEWQANRPQRAEQPWTIKAGSEFQVSSFEGQRWLVTRKKGDQSVRKLLNLSQRESHHQYYDLGNWALSPDGTLIALAEDVVGDEQYQISVVNLATGESHLVAKQSDTEILWSTDNQSVYVIKKALSDSRPAKLVKHMIRSAQSSETYIESDVAWLVSAYLASDERYAVIQVNSESATEQRILDLSTGELSKPLATRKDGNEYYADIAGGELYINSNHQGKFSLYKAKLAQVALPEQSKWQQVYESDEQANLENFYLFEAGIALVEQSKGRQSIVVLNHQGKEIHREPLSAEGSVGWVSRVGDYNSNVVRIRSMSMVQPAKWEELNLVSMSRTLLSQDVYPTYRQSEYKTERIFVDSNGAKVPVTLAYKPQLLTKESPVILYGYGAYAFTMKPYFMPQTVSLLERGVIYAIAHVRGSGYYGAQWHEQGRGTNKMNGIEDFVASAKYLSQFNGGQRKVAVIGSSAGGTLVAGAINQQPDLFTAASLNVPFVDVVASMSDTSLPLTAQQYQEWGNPNVANELTKMAQYDPMNNISHADYPATLVRIGWQDRRVPYWEGAKYHAKLKAMSSGTGPYLLDTDFTSGHATDRRKSSQRQAMDYAFLIHQLQQSE